MDEQERLTVEQAIAMLPDVLPDEDDPTVHTFRQCASALIGADWKRADIIKLIEESGSAQLGGEQCTRMGHGLVLEDDHGFLFVETK